MAKTFEEIGEEKSRGKVKSFEEIGITEEPKGKPMFIGVAPEPTFGQKWKEYFFSRGDEGRWTKPDRYEKFFNYSKWPAKTGLQVIGSVINRANKFVTAILPSPEIMKTVATLDPNALKDIFPSIWESRRAFSPVPGGADELRTFGEAMAEDWYEPIARTKPPWWYIPAVDIAFETLLFSGAAAQRASRVNKATFSNARLTRAEIRAAKRIYSTKSLAKIQPAQIRADLAKESAVIILSKADKAQLLKRGYKPIQIQQMTPLEAYQVMDDVPIVESAANTNLASATKQAIDRLTAGIKRAKRFLLFFRL